MGNETIPETAAKQKLEEDERRRRELKKKDKQKLLREKKALGAKPRHFSKVAPPLIRSEMGERVSSNLISSKHSPRIDSTLLPPPQIKIRKIKFILPLCASPAVKGERISAPVLRESPLYKVRLAHIQTLVISSERIERPILSMEQCKIMFPSMTVTPVISHKSVVKPLIVVEPVPDEKVIDEQQESTKESLKIQENVLGRGIYDEEIPELLNLIFAITGGKIDSRKAKILFVDELKGDSHIGALMTICARIYREKKGGTPEPYQLTHLTDDFKNEIIKWMKAEDKVFLVELKEKDWKTLKKSKSDWDYLLDRIKDLYMQNCGFIIFNKRINLEFPIKHQKIEILDIKPQKLDIELKNSISRMFWGFVDLDEHGTFDHVFDSAKNKFEYQLLKDAEEEPYFTVTKGHDGESNSHFEIKVFLVRYLTKVMKLEEHEIQNKIQVEVEHDGVTPDIWVPAQSEVYEVETLFGGGDYPINKIKTTIDKYDDKLPEIKTINIVLDNLTFLRHIKKLRGTKHTYNARDGWGGENGRSVEFYTLNLQNNSLVSMDQVTDHLKQLQEMLDRRELSVGEAEYVDMC